MEEAWEEVWGAGSEEGSVEAWAEDEAKEDEVTEDIRCEQDKIGLN